MYIYRSEYFKTLYYYHYTQSKCCKTGNIKMLYFDLIILRCKPIANFVSLVGFTFLFARRTDKVCMANWCTISRSHTGTYFLRYVKKCVPRV